MALGDRIESLLLNSGIYQDPTVQDLNQTLQNVNPDAGVYTTTTTSPTRLRNIAPDAGLNTAPTTNTSPSSSNTTFNQLLYNSGISNDIKNQISALAATATGTYSPQNIANLHQAIFNSALPQDVKVKLSNMITYQNQTPTNPTAGPGGGSGSGGGGGNSGGGGEGSGGGGGGTYSTANELIKALMGGDFSSIPLWAELTDPARNNPYTNPAMQPIIDGIQRESQEDWLGNMAALNELSEAGGRYGSGTYLAARTRATEETTEAVMDAISRLLGGAYETEQQRRTSLLQSAMSSMLGAAGLSYSDQNSIRQAQAARAANALANKQFNFSKQMQLAAGQQDALSDYLALLLGIGSFGGTTYQTTPGSYQPAMDPNAATLLGFFGGLSSGSGRVGAS